MKKEIIMVGFILLLSTSVHSAESVSQSQLQDQSQIHVDLDSVEMLTEEMRQYNFSQTNIEGIQELMRDMDRQGLSNMPVVNKIHEGIAKGIEPEIIIHGAERVRDRYQFAMHQADQLTSDEIQNSRLRELIVSGNSAGMTREDCTNIVSQLQTRMKLMEHDDAQDLAVETMTAARNMARHGVHAGTTSEVLVNALHQSYQAGDMVQMRHSFEQRARYHSPNSVAEQFSAEIHQGIDAGHLGASQTRRHGMESDHNVASGSASDDSRGSGAGSGSVSNNESHGSGGSGGGTSNSNGSSGGGHNSGSSNSGGTGSSSNHGSNDSGGSGGGMGGGKHGK